MTIPANAPLEVVLLVMALAWIAREVWPWWKKQQDTRQTAEQQHEDKIAAAMDLIGRTLVSLDFNLQEMRRMHEKQFEQIARRLEVLETAMVRDGKIERRKPHEEREADHRE